MRQIVLIGIVALAATPAVAQQWSHLATVGEQWEIYFDPARVTRERGAARFWIRRERVEGRSDGNHYDSQAEIDCAARTARVLLTITYRSDGSEASRDDRPVASDPITPDSLFETIRQRVC